MKLGADYTIEEQVTGRGTHGGIQVDVFPSFENYFICLSPQRENLDITETPRRLAIEEGAEILMKPV